MKKKAFLRALAGAPIGLTISVVITILVSVSIGDGKFYPVHPELTALCGGELTAVALQTAASLLYGAVWAAASVILRVTKVSPRRSDSWLNRMPEQQNMLYASRYSLVIQKPYCLATA